MGDPASVRSLKALARSMPELEEIMETAVAVLDQHTALVIALTTYLDRALEKLFEAVFVPGTDTKVLFLNDGPLATFSAKIKVGAAIGLFNEPIRSRLDTLRDLRNNFAHSSTHMHFSLPEVQAVCERLKYNELCDDKTTYPPGERWQELLYQFTMLTMMLSGTFVTAAAEWDKKDPTKSPNIARLLRGGIDYKIPMQAPSPKK